MPSNLVSARVPYAKKEAAACILRSLGATTSDLINDAFDFVLSQKTLPSSSIKIRKADRDFDAFLRASTLLISWSEIEMSTDYKDVLREGRIADYESLA